MLGPTKWSANSPTWEPVPPMTAAVSPKFFDGLGSLEIVWRCWIRTYGSQVSGSIQRSRCIKSYVLLVLMYGSEAWSVTKTLAQQLDAFRFRIPDMLPRQTTPGTPHRLLSSLPSYSRKMAPFFGHVARAGFKQDHHRSNHPVIGGCLSDAHVPLGWGVSTLM